MFRSYIDVAVRSFFANKLFASINVFGLAVGFASAILIGLYVADELNYDRFHPHAERVYRVMRDVYPRDGIPGLATAMLPLIAAEQLRADYPEIEAVGRAMPTSGQIKWGDEAFFETSLLFADSSLLGILGFEWLAGDPATALDEPTGIVLTESLARKYFGNGTALGQVLTYENSAELTVTGVIRDLPGNTHLQASALLPTAVFFRQVPEQTALQLSDSWNLNVAHTYVRLSPGASMEALAATFPDFIDRHVGGIDGVSRPSAATGLTPIPIADIHLGSARENEMREPGRVATVLALASIATGILLIACCNFMNLSTARSVQRGKEVGVRKTIGARRIQLIGQFLSESLGMALLATLLAIMLVELALPAFNAFTGKALAFDVFRDTGLQLALVLLALAVGFGAGAYPALYLSAFKPAHVLKNRMGFGSKDLVLRNLLVILQFSISIALVIATAVVFLQIRFTRSYDLGFDRERVLILGGSTTQGLTERWDVLRAALAEHPDIVSVTASGLVPGMENPTSLPVRVQGASDAEQRGLFPLMVDYGFFETYAIDLLAGRAFGADFSGDRLPPVLAPQLQGNFILNESAARAFGWTPEEAVGRRIQTDTRMAISGSVVGVVANSNFESLRNDVKPMLFMLGPQGGQWPFPVFNDASIRITGKDLAGTLAYVDATWKRVIPEFPVARRFLSDDFEALYQDDRRLGQLVSSFSALAILIACLGLFGLATFNAQRRIKEIGIRKVMGGSVWNIVLLLTNDYSKLVLISNVLAWPVAYIAMQQWLENFAYRIDLTPLIFIGSGLIALCIAWVTVGGTAAKAANQKPVLALRYE